MDILKNQAEVQEEVASIVRNAFKEIISWKHEYRDAPESIERISMKQQCKDGVLIKSWDEENHTVWEGIIEVTRIVQGLWDSSLDILSTYGMELMDPLLEILSMQPMTEDVGKYKASSLEMIEQIEVVDRDGVKFFF